MAFFKLRSKGSPGKEGRGNVSAAPAESVESLRRRARHRLVGAAVLVLLGVIGFPLLFDTQPRPVAVDIPIEMPDRAKVKPLAQAEAPAADTSRSASGGIALPPPANGVITERADGSEVAVAPPAAVPEPRREAVASSEPAKSEAPRTEPARVDAKPEPAKTPVTKSEAPKTEAKSEVAKAEPSKPEPAKPASPAPAPGRDDGARARALLEGKAPQQQVVAQAQPAAAAPAEVAGRFVVQVGAFADAAKAQETRQKLERAGLKTYTHVAKTPQGERTRVRVGPFSSRADADKAAARIKALALPAAVLTL
ncbi:MAG: SPOR domain-containing protein [Gammaproteobacteria bacterium]|uniref:SPOR domain-containing protein n=1 Tax=Pseudacidovorax sp. TaxID=1934311 RepID=UPI001B76BBF4|nr:SPOR domain-containing protein [Pseudacidovorax sp.]MBP6895108.1 SPOR domain-containing protein [Pseudacidovorax sp.]